MLAAFNNRNLICQRAPQKIPGQSQRKENTLHFAGEEKGSCKRVYVCVFLCGYLSFRIYSDVTGRYSDVTASYFRRFKDRKVFGRFKGTKKEAGSVCMYVGMCVWFFGIYSD